jgi:hypothetical protein
MGHVMTALQAAFARTAAGLEHWDDPHPPPDRIVAEEEYSRVTNPSRWCIVGARADAWIDALVEVGLATVERDADPRWVEPPPTVVTRTDLVTPSIDGGLPLVICRSRIEDVPDAGVTLGAGDPAVRLAFIPDCGCDACDSGSQDVLEHLDSYVRSVVTGEFRSLRRGRQSIMVLEDGGWQGSNVASRRGGRTRDRVAKILAGPTRWDGPNGWDEVTGPSWLTGPHGDMRH